MGKKSEADHVEMSSLFFKKKIFFGWPMPLFSFSTHKKLVKKTQRHFCFSKKPYTLAGFEPGSDVSEADATAPLHRVEMSSLCDA
jgi:hypothetical protein